MSAGGRLVVLDRQGRAGKSFSVAAGLATLGRDLHCDVRVLLPHVSRHHATIIVHAVQTVIRNESEGETLVNGRSVSVAALRHGDVVSIGGRDLRWEYADPGASRPLAAETALQSDATAAARGRRARGGGGGGGARGAAARASAGGGAGGGRAAAVQLALHLQHRASMPGHAGGKQVAIVQPQRRDTGQTAGAASPRQAPHVRPRGAPADAPAPPAPAPAPHDAGPAPVRRDTPRPRHSTLSPRSLALMNTTKATLWIESRKSSPRQAARPPARTPPRRARASSARVGTPALRVAVLRKAQSAHKPPKVTKIEDPLKIDQTKQAAIMLMTGHTPKLKALSPKPAGARKSPAFLVKIPSPVRKTPRAGGRTSGRSPKGATPNIRVTPKIGVTPKRASTYGETSFRSSRRSTAGQSVSVLEITDSDARNSTLRGSSSKVSNSSTFGSPLPPSPKKSSLKDPRAKNSTRKTESIKFDLSNLENYSENQSDDVLVVTDHTAIGDSGSEDDMTLHYDTSSTSSPSPRKAIHSRISGRGKSSALSESRTSQQSFVSAASPRANKSRGSVNTTAHSRRSSKTPTDRSRNITASKTRSPRTSNQNLESYSIVDLVSIDSNETARSGSVYDSAGSTRSSSIVFGTPQTTGGRKTRSTIEPNLLGSSTPYVSNVRTSTRSQSSPNISARTSSPDKSNRSSKVSRRSKSLTTPENTQKHISVNSTRISRASKSRSRINDSDLQYIDGGEPEGSPKSSRRGSRADKSHNISSISTSSPNQRSGTRKSLTSVLSTRSLDSSRSSQSSQKRVSANIKSKTIGVIQTERKGRSSPRSKSLNMSKRKLSNSLKLSMDPSVSPSILNNISPSPQNQGRISRSTVADSPRSGRRSSPKNLSLRTTSDSPQNERRSSRKNLTVNTTIADSPQSNRRSSGKYLTLNVITDSPKNDRRSSRKNLTLNITTANSSQSDGTITPEHTDRPEEVGTPVLSIQSLLDSSQSSFASQRSQKKRVSVNVKRKTVAVMRPERNSGSRLQSKSLNISKRKSSRSLRLSKDPSIESDGTDENALQPDNEDTVTPKSAVKLVHEAVKNKHSTSKKPQSKRSLIDNLNDSDIIKHLFNSPVKRKLSQSMTEFSRKRLFDDDEVVPRRPTRNTVAYTGRTPDNSLLLHHTGNITPEKFVSPLSTPSDSPNLTGIRRLYRKNTPDNDLRNVKGVKGLLKTPRPRKSVKNDLSNVSGVHTLFKRKSPANDLRNVSGVKKTLQRRSPANDLTDVRGVRRMFRQEKQRNVFDFSGIEELFNDSNNSYKDSERLFDQLIGKPQIKSVYSKSLLTKSAQRNKKLRKTKSLQFPIETMTDSPERWLEQELRKRLHGDNAAKIESSTSKARKSLNKSSGFTTNVTRELQNLVTDTVEGDAPILEPRVRNSTIRKSQSETTEMKKSASELYSARKLPLKKRSLVDRSKSVLEKSSEKNKSNLLPLKKRAVVHSSTPLKVRFYNSTMNASELARVSPIAAAEHTRDLENETTIRLTHRLTKSSPKSKGKAESTPNENEVVEKAVQLETSRQPRARRAANIKTINEKQELSPKQNRRRGTIAQNAKKQETELTTSTKITEAKSVGNKETSMEAAPKTRKTRNVAQIIKQQSIESKPSPKKTRAAKAMALSVLQDQKSTRSRRTVDDTKVSNTRKRRQSLVIAKKPPGMSPKPEPKATRKTQESDKSNVKVKSPKGRGRPKVAVVVINRMSPKFKPRATKDKVVSPKVKSPAAPRSTRGKAGGSGDTGEKNKKVSPKKIQNNARSKRTNKSVEKPEVAQPQTKRSRNTRGTNNDTEKLVAQNKRGKVQSEESAQPPGGRNRRARTDIPVVPETRKGRKRKLPDDDETVIPPKVTKSEIIKSTRGRPKDKTITPPKATKSEVTKPTRGRSKTQTLASPEATENAVSKPARGRSKTQTLASPKATKSVVTKATRGRTKTQTLASPKATKSEVTKATRGRSKAQTLESPKATKSEVAKPTRGRSKAKTPASPEATKSEVTKPTRGRTKNQTVASPTATKNTKAARGRSKDQTVASPKAKKPTRGKKTVIELTETETSKGRRTSTVKKVTTEVKIQRGEVENRTRRVTKVVRTNTRQSQEAASVDSAPHTGRKRKTTPAKAEPAKKTRRGAAKASASPAKEPVARGRSARGKNAAASSSRSRRR